MNQTGKNILAFVVFLFICLGAAQLGSLFTIPSLDDWYQQIQKPAWTPPNWVFAPVWTLLYVSMAVAAWGVWKERDRQSVALPIGLFFAQLLVNVLWSYLFFTLHLPGWALLDLVILWVLILFTLITFYRVKAWAGLILIPYLLWVAYAGTLNAAIWQMNG